jgi:Predicted flavin-nucleotide-binding protein
VCIEVTQLDALVYSRSAKYHSMNYHSVVCFGRGRVIDDPEAKARIFDAAVRRYFPGREIGRDYMAATLAQLNTTALLEIVIEEWSAKGREGGPKGPRDADPHAPGTCGVIPL